MLHSIRIDLCILCLLFTVFAFILDVRQQLLPRCPTLAYWIRDCQLVANSHHVLYTSCKLCEIEKWVMEFWMGEAVWIPFLEVIYWAISAAAGSLPQLH